jgi:hypothetical protein
MHFFEQKRQVLSPRTSRGGQQPPGIAAPRVERADVTASKDTLPANSASAPASPLLRSPPIHVFSPSALGHSDTSRLIPATPHSETAAATEVASSCPADLPLRNLLLLNGPEEVGPAAPAPPPGALPAPAPPSMPAREARQPCIIFTGGGIAAGKSTALALLEQSQFFQQNEHTVGRFWGY